MTSLEQEKASKKHDIDLDTQRLILQGFDFDGARLPLTESDRSDYIGLKTLESSLSWPVTLETMDGGYYALEFAKLDSFIAAALAVYRGYRESGRILKQECDAAQNSRELGNVDITRT